MADLSKAIKGGLSAVRNLSRSADEAMEAKRLAREAASPPIKASEAYGQYEGSYLKPIFYDRMKVDLSKGKLGGPGFSGIQLVDPNYANAKAVAGVTDQKMATRILNRNTALVPKGADVIWTPSVGGLEQHKSNSTMFGEFADIFANQRKNMSAEQIQKLSDRASAMTDNNGRLIFPNGIDLGARNFRQQVKTYDQRSLMADIFAGRGVGGEKGRTVPVEELLEKNLDPNVAGAGTLDLGNRLFRLEGNVIDRPDLHSDYRKILTGEDLDVNYLPVPIRDVYSDWEAQKALDLAAQGKNRAVTQMDYTKNDPTVQLTEELLTKMQKAGHKKGGAVNIKHSDARLAAAIANRMAKGGKVDIKAADARLAQAMARRMAGGGGAFKTLTFKAEGGPAFKQIQFKADGGPAFKKLTFMAEGGGAFKKLQFMDGGGIATSGGTFSADDLGVTDKELNAPLFSAKRLSDIKKNASEMFDETKQSLASDYDRLKNSARARAQLAKITAAQLAGGAPDLAHLGVDLIVDPLKSVTVDKLLTKPRPRSVLEGPPKAGEKEERVPMFGSISDALKTEDGLPIGGSEHMMKRAQEAGLMHTGRFSPITEIGGAILGGAGASKASKGIVKGYDKLLGKNSGKLSGLQPEAMTAPAGTPQGATYATKQEGPFYRVSPTSHDLSGAKSRGLREADELQGQASVGSGAGEAGSQVPLRISDEEVARLVSNPETNQPLQIAKRFTKETQGTDFTAPDIPESSLAKQSAIGRAHQLAVEGSPEYKTSVFDAYAKQMPDLLEQVGAKDYDDLMEKAYRQLAKETDEQFKQLPYNFSYHRAGEGDYLGGSKDMMADVHGNKHLYVFQGGDPHDFLNRIDKASGLNENEKFRAVHDLLGHAIYGNQFGPKGEEAAWAIHQQMYSPLARLAMTAETRGQNSLVNYSPLNVKLKSNIAKLEDLEVEALRRKDTALVNEIRAAKRQEFANNFQFAPQKAVLLPPEFLDPKFAGGLPDYLSAANRPAKGTESQSVLTHFSNDPNLQLLDPKRYGTGIKGAEAERLKDYAGGVRDRSYVYLGEPGTVAPEPGLGVNRYRGESQNLYDITKDPLAFRALARESNRTPFTAKYNAGITHPLQEANDYERLVKEYGYEGMINPNASKPMGIMFKPTPVQPRARGGLTQLRAR